MSVLLTQYENSVEVPKLTDLSNYWIEMEIAFANIWKGRRGYGSGFCDPENMSQLQRGIERKIRCISKSSHGKTNFTDRLGKEVFAMIGFFIALLSGALMSVQGVFNTEVTKVSSMWTSAAWVQLSALITCLIAWGLTDPEEPADCFSGDA